MTEQFANAIVTTLNGTINNSTTTVIVDSATGLPASGDFRIKIDDEIMKVTSRSGSTLTVVRGQEGTSAATHLDEAPVRNILTAGALIQGFADTSGLGLKKIAEAVGTGSSGVIEFSSIPATYRHLLLMISGRSDGSPGVGAAAIAMTFEISPTAGAYNGVLTRGNGSTASASTTDGGSSISVGSATAATGSANVPGVSWIYIFDYAGTSLFKAMTGQSLGVTTIGATGFYSDMFSGLYESTAAIDRIRLTLSNGNWTTTSRVTLYGIPE